MKTHPGASMLHIALEPRPLYFIMREFIQPEHHLVMLQYAVAVVPVGSGIQSKMIARSEPGIKSDGVICKIDMVGFYICGEKRKRAETGMFDFNRRFWPRRRGRCPRDGIGE